LQFRRTLLSGEANEKVKKMGSAIYRKKDFDVKPIMSPTVPEGRERFAVCLPVLYRKGQLREVTFTIVNLF